MQNNLMIEILKELKRRKEMSSIGECVSECNNLGDDLSNLKLA